MYNLSEDEVEAVAYDLVTGVLETGVDLNSVAKEVGYELYDSVSDRATVDDQLRILSVTELAFKKLLVQYKSDK